MDLTSTRKENNNKPSPHHSPPSESISCIMLSSKKATKKKSKAKETSKNDTTMAAEKDAAYYKKEVKKEKAGKRKLYLSLVKLAEELKKIRTETASLEESAQYRNQTWYTGGLWRAPQVLPEVQRNVADNQRARPREAISLSDMFLNLVIVTGFTRVGLAITSAGSVQMEHILYFAVFWTIWCKETSYATRFDTTDLSAQLETLLTCFAVLFASLSVSLPMDSEGGVRIMIMAAFCSSMHFFLMARVLWWYKDAAANSVEYHVKQYSLYNLILNFSEATAWIVGIFYAPLSYRWIVFIVGVLMGLRIPRSILSNDFHGEYFRFLGKFTRKDLWRIQPLKFCILSILPKLPIRNGGSCLFSCWDSCYRV